MATTNSALTPWESEVKTLKDILAPRPPMVQIVQDFFKIPSLNIAYGAPADFKSLLLQDLAMCIATGIPWLTPAPWETNPRISAFPVMQGSVAWIDFDNGLHRTLDRFQALYQGYAQSNPNILQQDLPLYIYSMVSPALDITKGSHVADLVDILRDHKSSFVAIDNLGTVMGGKDENTSEVTPGMANLRRISEKVDCAMTMVHHSRKDTGYKGNKGDNLRGFSGIRGAIDRGLFIKREPGTDSITITSEKTRDNDIDPIGATFTYDEDPLTRTLVRARFYQTLPMASNIVVTVGEIRAWIVQALQDNGKSKQSDLVKYVQELAENDGKKLGSNRVRDMANQMVQQKQINVSTGASNAKFYSV